MDVTKRWDRVGRKLTLSLPLAHPDFGRVQIGEAQRRDFDAPHAGLDGHAPQVGEEGQRRKLGAEQALGLAEEVDPLGPEVHGELALLRAARELSTRHGPTAIASLPMRRDRDCPDFDAFLVLPEWAG